MIYFVIFFMVSALVMAASLIYAVHAVRNRENKSRIFSSLNYFTAGVFAAGFLVFLPVYYLNYDFGDPFAYVRPLILSIHNTLRLFILDGEFDTVRDALTMYVPYDLFHRILSFYAAVLYVLAPLLTFGNVLSLFKNLKGELLLKARIRRPTFLFSELNINSLALAKNIVREEDRDGRKINLVFLDVFTDNEESDYELATEAADLGAILLKKDILHINLQRIKNKVDIYLIGKDESENVSQAAKIVNRLNAEARKKDIHVFVFARGESSRRVLESQSYENLLPLSDADPSSESGDIPPFIVRRVDIARQVIWKTVPKMNLHKSVIRNPEGSEEIVINSLISILIVGLGTYGLELLKMVLWFYQMPGIHVEINVVDKIKKDKHGCGGLEAIVRRHCPEVMRLNGRKIDGDADYDICFYEGIDCTGSDFEDLIRNQTEAGGRIKRTTMAFVSLGNEDLNIETAAWLRTLFDRIHGINAEKMMKIKMNIPEKPMIYAVVFSDEKGRQLNLDDNERNSEEGHINASKDAPLQIHIIGTLSEMNTRNMFFDKKEEKLGLRLHTSWVDVQNHLVEELQGNSIAEGQEACEINRHKEIIKYHTHEYFRHSSLAKAIYTSVIETDFKDVTAGITNPDHDFNKQYSCMCPNCKRRKKYEHMRWNAFMRTEGYIYGQEKSDRAKTHKDLVPFDSLSVFEQLKD